MKHVPLISARECLCGVRLSPFCLCFVRVELWLGARWSSLRFARAKELEAKERRLFGCELLLSLDQLAVERARAANGMI